MGVVPFLARKSASRTYVLIQTEKLKRVARPHTARFACVLQFACSALVVHTAQASPKPILGTRRRTAVPLITIVEDYIFSAMKHAVLEELDDGTIGATIPECPGVLGFGGDVHSCAGDLYVQLQDWVRVSLELGNPLPVIDGIDLNSETGKLLATYHRSGNQARPADYFESDEALEAALEGRTEAG